MKKGLLIWGIPIEKVEEAKALKIPLSSSGDIGISETFDPRKTHPDFVFPWVSANPRQEASAMPDEVMICLKNVREINFDYLNYTDKFFIVSKNLYDYMASHGFDYENNKSRVRFVDRKGSLLTDEIFYFVRHYWWDIKVDELEFVSTNSDTDEPNRAETASTKNFLMTNQADYTNELFVNAELKEEIRARFRNPMLFTLEEWNNLNNDDWGF